MYYTHTHTHTHIYKEYVVLTKHSKASMLYVNLQTYLVHRLACAHKGMHAVQIKLPNCFVDQIIFIKIKLQSIKLNILCNLHC